MPAAGEDSDDAAAAAAAAWASTAGPRTTAAAAAGMASIVQRAPPQRTLYLAGVGEAVGTDVEALRRMLEAFGPLDDDDEEGGSSRRGADGGGACAGAIRTFAGKGYVLARFRTPEGAAQAVEGLSGRVMEGRPITARFNSLGDDEQGNITEPPPEPLDPAECADVHIPGLELVEEFLTPEEAEALLAFADRDGGRHWAAGAAAGMPGMGRRVQHFGYAFDYATRGVAFGGHADAAEGGDLEESESLSSSSVPPLPFVACPAFAAAVRRLLGGEGGKGLLRMAPDQMTLNEYLPGQGISGHIETHDAFRDGLLSLSLGAPVVMDFREPSNSGQKKALFLPPRSALALHGEARYLWTHGIAARTWDKVNGARLPRTHRRVSFTLRRVIPPLPVPSSVPCLSSRPRRPCLCAFPDRCPSSSTAERDAYLARCKTGDGAIFVSSEARRPTELERANVHAVYETISTHWNHTRAIRRVHWPRVVAFLQSLPPHALIADIGCGDGKYLELRRYNFHPTAFALGCDRSVRLLACAAAAAAGGRQQQEEGGQEEREPPPPKPEVFACDVLQVPFRDNAFDAALCIAVLHHLSTEAHRVQALRELCRVVRVGGLFDVHVWALEQEDGSRRRFDDQDQLVPFRMQAKYAAQSLDALASAASSTDNPPAAAAAVDPRRSNGTGGTGGPPGPPPVVEAVPSRVDPGAKLVTYERYCHVYREWELEGLLNKLGNEFELAIVDRGYDKGNWFVTVCKLGDAIYAYSP